MNPILSAALGSILRWVLALAAGYLVKAGIWTGSDAETYVAAGSMAALGLGLSIWNKYHSRIKLLTALELAGATEHEVKALMANTVASPPILTPATAVPVSPLPVADRLL
jgi:hypothetical protein